MKLLCGKIDGFGKFSDATISFTDGLNSFCFENGWGKTTIVAFIRAMLYGLPPDRANAKERGGRARFRPFSGGAFGGSLELEAGGHRYMIKRTFDARRESRDEVTAYMDGKHAPTLEEDFGGSITGMDEQSFVRTIYAACEDMQTGSTGDIQARLNDYMQGGVSAEEAIKRLDAARKKYLADRGNGGLINAQRAVCENIRADIYAAEQQSKRLDGLYGERAVLKAKADKLNAALDRAGDTERRRARRQTYERYRADAQRELDAAKRIEGAYPQGIPDANQTERIVRLLAQRAARQTPAQTMPKAALDRLDELENIFRQQPTDAQLEQCRRCIEKIKSAETPPAAHKKRRAPFALMALAVLAIAGGIACAALNLAAAGIILCAAGGVAGIAGLAIKFNEKLARIGTSRPAATEEGAFVQKFLARYGYTGGIYDYGRMISDLNELNSLREQRSAYERGTGVAEAEKRAADEQVRQFFATYAPTAQGTPEQMLHSISADRAELERHSALYREYLARAAEYSDSKDFADNGGDTQTLVKAISELNAQVSALEEQIDACERCAENLPALNDKLNESRKKLESYESAHSGIVKTINYIKTADGEIREAFVMPVAQSFRQYSARAAASLGKNAAIDRQFAITFEGGGVPRGEEFMSSGQRAAGALCFRLALCDCIFRQERPFLLLDDPFALLDEQRLESLTKILRALSSDRQIIYFTCHPSRRV